LSLPDPDLAAEMYEWLSETLERNGYVQYEISNWARPGYECQHNLQYWRGLPYLGLGAGAHGYANGIRYSNALRIKTYIERLSNYSITNYEFPISPATVNHHRQSLRDDMSEFMMTGLRLTWEGISKEDFQRRFGESVEEIYGKEIGELLRLGLLENGAGERIRITRRGRLLGNQVFVRFV
jgi:oxygen-independent coproporphyrinogen-3 oxidase